MDDGVGSSLMAYEPGAIFVSDPDELALCGAAKDIATQIAILVDELQILRCNSVLTSTASAKLLDRQFDRIRDAIAILSSIVDDIEGPLD